MIARVLIIAALALVPSVAHASQPDSCRYSFSPECLRPYVEAAKRDAARMELHPGSAGASIRPPSITYGPLSPKGFRGAARVTITGSSLRGSDRVK